MNWNRRKFGAGLCAAIGLLLAACSSGSDSASDSLTVAWEFTPENWAPGTDNNHGMMGIPYETLIKATPEGTFEPMLATSWEVTDQSMTLELRADVTFHDGTPFNAEAVKINLEHVQDEAGPLSAHLDSIETVKVLDEYSIELVLNRPDPAMEANIASRAGYMASPTAIEDGSIVNAPVGTGPWAYSAGASTAGTTEVFDLFEDYYESGAVQVERIELVAMSDPAARFAAVRTGEVDITEHPANKRADAEAAGFTTATVPGAHVSVMMTDRGPGGTVADLETRRAICSAIDKEAFGLVGGEGSQTMVNQRFLEGQYGHNPDIERYQLDPKVAAAASGLDLDIGIFDGWSQYASALAGELEEEEINLNVEIVPTNQYFANWFRDWDIGLGDSSEPHPYLWYRTWFAADAPNNVSGMESPDLKAAADAAIAAGTSPEAEALWQKVIKIIHDEALTCVHMNYNFVAIWDSGRVKDVELFPFRMSYVDYRTIELVK